MDKKSFLFSLQMKMAKFEQEYPILSWNSDIFIFVYVPDGTSKCRLFLVLRKKLY